MTDEYEGKVPLAKCHECPLSKRPLVESDGPGYPEEGKGFVVVGEAPGYEEANEGVPFIGKSGKLLKQVLGYNDIDPKKVFYTNAVLCHPDSDHKGKQMAPNSKAIKACNERLKAEIEACDPSYVIALGTVASKAVLGTTEGVTSLRKGRPIEKDGYKVIPTFHTAAALREPDRFPSIVSDVGKANRIEVGWEPTKVTVANDGNAIALLRDQLDHARDGTLAGDIELDEPYDVFNPNFLCFGISETPGKATVYPRETLPIIRELLDAGFADKRWIWQNGKFDIKHLWSLGMPHARVDEDTMLAHYATDERKGVHDLEQMGTEILGAPYWKEEARKAIEEERTLGFLPPEKLWEYNGTDADVTYRLLDVLKKEMSNDGVTEVYEEILIPASEAFARMEYRGVRVDLERLDEVEIEVIKTMEMMEGPTKEWVDNPRSQPQVLAALHRLGYDVPDTQEDTIKGINHPFIEALLGYRGAHKIHSTYVKGLRRRLRGDRVHPTFNIHGTETGRTSCKDPNLQNQPIDHPIRECFVPSLGNAFIEADYAGIELRVAATVCKDPGLRRQFLEGRNPHKELAVSLYGEGYDPRQYVNTKSVNFGTLYEETAGHLAHRNGMKVKEARDIQKAFFGRYPAIKKYHEDTKVEIRQNHYLTSLYGRKRRFWLITRENARDVFKEGINFKISSVASDILTSALIKIQREKPYLNPVNDVHDSLMFDVPAEDQEEAEREIIEIMESVNPLDVPLVAEAERSDRWKMKKT